MHSIAKIATILVVCSLGALAISHQKMREYEFDRVALYFRQDAPENSAWMNVGSPASDDLVSFTLFLKQRNLHLLEQALLADSDPHSAKYGQHWSREEILDLIAPTPQVQKEVLTWLYTVADVVGNEHIISLTNAKDSINVIASVKYVEKLFATQLFKFENSKMNKEGIKHLGELSVPRSVAGYIEIITGVTDFMPPIKQTVAKKAPRDDDNQCNVPYSIKNLYNVPLDLTVTNPASNQSIYAEAYQQDGFGFGSLAYWETANGIASNPINCILGSGASFIIPNDTDGEAQLDTQMMTGMAVGAKTCFWMIEGWMLDFAVQMFINPKTPLVISASYGWTEWDQCDNATTNGGSGLGNCSSMHIPNSQQYVNRTNIEFQKIGLTGRTLLVASGDDGNAGGHGSPNGCTKIAPMFPAASPWVLTCGATSIEPSSSVEGTLAAGAPPLCTNSMYQCTCSTSTNEQPAQQNNTAEFDSGGGFSVYSPTPSYQKKAVSSYLSSGIYLPPSSYGWNPQGRGYPDIAGVGENFCVLDPGGSCNLVAGTSAASPLIASLVTLLNQDRLNAGKSSLGFINPVIYDMFDSDAAQFFNNNFEGTNGGECGTQFGFHSKAGMWSPITGVGSPKFDQIRTYINSLP